MKKNIKYIAAILLILFSVVLVYGINNEDDSYNNSYRKLAHEAFHGNQLALKKLILNASYGGQGYLYAAEWLGTYYRVIGVNGKSYSYSIGPAKAGYLRAECNVGSYYYVIKNYRKMVKWCRKAAKGGSAQGQACMGAAYEKGQSVTESSERALYYFKKAEKKGYPPAFVALSDMAKNCSLADNYINSIKSSHPNTWDIAMAMDSINGRCHRQSLGKIRKFAYAILSRSSTFSNQVSRSLARIILGAGNVSQRSTQSSSNSLTNEDTPKIHPEIVNMPTSQYIMVKQITWHGNESAGSTIDVGHHQLPLIRFEADYQGTYKWDGHVGNKDKNILSQMAIPDSMTSYLAVYKVGGDVFLLPRGWRVVEAEDGADGSRDVVMRGSQGWMAFYSDGGCAGCAIDSSKHWLPWIGKGEAYPIHAVSIDSGISAYTYGNSSGGAVNGVAVFNKRMQSFENMAFYYNGDVKKLPTTALNFFLFSNKPHGENGVRSRTNHITVSSGSIVDGPSPQPILPQCYSIISSYKREIYPSASLLLRYDHDGLANSAAAEALISNLRQIIRANQNLLNVYHCGITLPMY